MDIKETYCPKCEGIKIHVKAEELFSYYNCLGCGMAVPKEVVKIESGLLLQLQKAEKI